MFHLKEYSPGKTLLLILFISGINAIYLSIAHAFEWAAPTSYLPVGDLFADFIKVVVSYPGHENLEINNNIGLEKLFKEFIANNPYGGITNLTTNSFTHFHLPPLTTLLSLVSLELMHYFPPQTIFYFLIFIILFTAYIVLGRISDTRIQEFSWLACFVASYPFLFMLQRGNLFSAATTLCIIFFIISAIKNKLLGLGIIMFSIAINIRPNAIVFFPILLLAGNKYLARNIIITLTYTIFIFILSNIISTVIYNDYSITNFFKALGIYHKIYVVDGGGTLYNSSIYLILKLILHNSRTAEFIGLLIALLVSGVITFRAYYHKVNVATFIFFLCSAYAYISPVFADYHLLIFIMPIIAIKMCGENKNTRPIYYSCIFLLSPKNYYIYNDVSVIELLNPLIILGTCSYIFINHYIEIKKLIKYKNSESR
jgi:hypothetical protein